MSKRTFQLLLVPCLVTGTLCAASDPFVGKWKINASKSKLIDYMKVKSLGANKYALNLGDGTFETIVADGTDQPEPGLFRTTESITVEGPPHTWKLVRKKNSHALVTGIWTLSQNGKTLSDHFTANRPDGSTFRFDYLYKRTTAGSGFAGTWVSTSEPHSAFELQIRPYEGDGLSFITSGAREAQDLKFDGKDYPDLRPNVMPSSASSGRRVNEHTLDVTDKIEGKITDTREMTLSPDLKTMTVTVHASGLSNPNTIVVFDRE
jgi:hypothetical protein